MNLPQLYKSTQRKIDKLMTVRLRLARFLREKRMAEKLREEMLKKAGS